MSRHIPLSRQCMVAAVAVVSCAAPALAAPTLRTTVLPIYQVGNGAQVHLGHVVRASTNFNRLIAGGTFSASCAHPDMLPATGGSTLSTSNFVGGLTLVVTIPTYQPANVAMPGFYSLPRGTTVDCTYNWTSRATEGGYSVGPGGISYQIGNGEAAESFFQQFKMSVPGDTNSDDWQSCIP